MADNEAYIQLKNVDNSFQERSDFVFAKLGSLEPTTGHCESTEEKKKDRNTRRTTRLPNRVPDHVLSPENWTKYSLKDDGAEKLNGMGGDNLNRYVAHTFLDDLRKRKDKDSTQIVHKVRTGESQDRRSETQSQESEAKMSFQKPSGSRNAQDQSEKGNWRDGAFVMPEHIVGSKKAKISKVDAKCHADCAAVSLGHLTEEKKEKEEVKKEEIRGENISHQSIQMDGLKQKAKRHFRKRKLIEEADTSDTDKKEKRQDEN